MPYHLCIDGGGSKTLAVIAHVAGGKVVRAAGQAGPSNLTFGLDVCLDATRAAVDAAVDALKANGGGEGLLWPPKTSGRDGVGGPREGFASVWVAYAGCARTGDRALLFPHLERMLGPNVRLSSDGELLTAPMISSGARACITLICGTGSLALLWRRDDAGDEVYQAQRSGGWGALLGDEGSGWALGREAVKAVLTSAANASPPVGWHADVLNHFGITDADRLIATACALDPALPLSLADSERKRRIAACARIVVDAARVGDPEALTLVDTVAAQVCDTLAPLVAHVHPANTMLVVAGGLGQEPTFWNRVEDLFAARGWRWDEVVKVPEPAQAGLDALLQQASQRSTIHVDLL